MNHKNIFILTCLIFLLPSVSFSENNDNSSLSNYKFYVSGQYKPSISYFNKFSVTIRDNYTQALLSLKETMPPIASNFIVSDNNLSNFTVQHNPTYKNSLLGIGGNMGIKLNNYRVELEVSYENFDLKVPSEYFYEDAYKYFLVKTESHPSYNNHYYYLIKNNSIKISPILVNVCYDVPPKNTQIFPYLCVGAGINVIDFLDKVHFKFSYQAKIGISYFVLPNLALFIDGSFHSHLSNELTYIPTYGINSNYHNLSQASSVRLNINFLSSSIGIRFIY
ncbi:P44/Msp2 family outer membrane protein [Ehrlichia ruminantium]|uniref:P44/Msp2 family outer membrane protein n=1 Tax=Ehrlichia ruminantium TaxID=779 RepID=A0AAE6Q9J8_EHRRU|nr:P44/Msp2 family outer membrane protein [Ehrlichia ruminantium]QGR02925.1 P44/Msp2 family outer membrane protein [Ehrlichia ruminantium]QGR03849.1 P44/Msp2 family outer membrane protein [Ehrlichia ruminantium]QGR04776.1 P44/Msp2 family outer membrane protein [Ehrlichia ruminantium]